MAPNPTCRTTIRSALVIASCTAALAWQQAYAQATAGGTLASPTVASTQGGDAPRPRAASAAGSRLQQVVVTAERYAENAQNAPIAIQALSADQLETAGVTAVKNLTLLVPGLQVGLGGPYTQIYIRGVGDFGSTALADPGVAPFLDGVYISREAAIGGMFYDLSRVEVLKGPQGTLYGMNTTGGAINLITNRPTFDKFGGYADLEIGNYGEVNGEGALNLPLSDHWAARLAFQTVNHSGYLSDGTDDAAQQSGRIQTLWKPGDKLSLLLEADYTHEGGHGEGSAVVYPPGQPSHSPWLGSSDPRVNAVQLGLAAAAGLCVPTASLNGLDAAPPPRGQLPPPSCDTFGAGPGTLLYSGNAQSSFQDNQMWGVHAQLDWDLGWATLTVIPAYRSTRVGFIFYPLFETYTHPDTSGETTFEARLAHTTDKLTWVAGVYYFTENQGAFDDVFAGLLNNTRSIEGLHNTDDAAFGQATVSLTDSLRLIAGVRYNHDRKELNGAVFNLYPSLANLSPAPGVPAACPDASPCLSESFAGAANFDDVTWKSGLEYDLAAHNMVYFTASTGFKAGGLNDQAGTPLYNPEKLLAFELGSKNRFLDDRLQVNLELFHWKYTDQQIPFVKLDVLGNPSFTVVNAAGAALNGFDLNVDAKPTSSDTVHMGVEYDDTRYDNFSYAIPLNPIVPPPTQGVTTGCAVNTGAVNAVVDCSGNQLIAAPRWSGTVAWEHVFDVGSGASVLTHLDAQFASARWLSLDFLGPEERAPSYVLENVAVTYIAANDRWELMGFIRNISDRPVYTLGSQNPWYPGGVVGATIGDPRTYGARVTVNF